MSLNFSFGPCEIVCNADIGNINKYFLSLQWLVNCVTYLLIMSMVVVMK